MHGDILGCIKRFVVICDERVLVGDIMSELYYTVGDIMSELYYMWWVIL